MFNKLLVSLAVAFFSFDVNVNAQVANSNSNLNEDSEINAVYGLNNGQQVRLSRNVERKVLLEEYTSMGCVNCPKGIIGLEKAKQVYGDKVIPVAVHYNDRLKCAQYINQIVEASKLGFPRASVDRYIKLVDPYFGSTNTNFGLGDDIDAALAVPAVAEVIAGGSMEDNVLTMKADVKFLFSGDANYGVGFVLLEDGMTHEKWTQRNGLIGGYSYDPLFDRWVNGTDPMYGIVFNHIAITAVDIDNGIEGSIPATVTEEENISCETTYDLSTSKKIMNRDNLSVVAVLIDRTTGQIANANIIKMSDILAIDGVEADNEDVKEVARYTVDGRMVTSPVKGLNIIKMSDGTAKKVMVK